MGFTGMFSVETILKIIGFGVKVGRKLPARSYKTLVSKFKEIMHQSDSSLEVF